MVLCHNYSSVATYPGCIIPTPPHTVVGATESEKKRRKDKIMNVNLEKEKV